MADGSQDIASMITDAANRHGVDPAFALSVGRAESSLNPKAVSPKDARGVMQLTKGTASDLGVNRDDVGQNIEGGVRYLRQLSDQFEGNRDLIAAAYNAGPNAVKKHGGIPPYPETQDYVRKVSEGAGPSLDELERHMSGDAPAAAPEGSVGVSALPQVPGYIGDPGDPAAPGYQRGIPLGGPGGDGPSMDELEAHMGKTPAPSVPQTAAQKAAGADASKFEQLLSIPGLVMSKHGQAGAEGADLANPFLHGLGQGFTDEAKGAAFGGITGAKNFVLNALGKPVPYGMADAQAAETNAARGSLAAISKAHPVSSTMAEMTGNALPWMAGGELLAPAKVAAAAPNALGQAVQYGGRILSGGVKGSAAGAAAGALSGLGNAEGDLSQRLPEAETGALTGAVIGGGLGAAVPAVSPLVGGAVNALGSEATAAGGALKQGVTNALGRVTGKPVETTAADYFASKSPAAQAVKGALAPAEVAETIEPTAAETRLAQQRVLQMMQAKGMHPDELRAVAQDIPHTTAEAIGSQTTNHLASLGRRAGTTPDELASQIAQRSEEFAPSVMDDFAMAARIDPRQARVLNEDVTSTIHKDEVTPAYQAALDVNNPKPVMTPTLAKLQQDPDVQKAITAAERLVAKSGRETSMIGPKIDPDTGGPMVDPVSQQPVMERQPTPEVWDQTKKMISQMVKREHGVEITSGPDGIQNHFLKMTAQDMTDALKEAIPGYDKALASASDELGRKAAYKAGNDSLFKSTVSLADFQKQRAGLSPDALEANTAGVANALFDQAQRGLLTPAKLKQPLFQSKVREVLGDQADMFLDRVTQRARLQATGNRLMPGAGSQTTPLLHAAGETAPVQDALGNFVKEATHAKASPLTFIGKHVLKAGIGDKAANVVETPGYRNAYGRILRQHPRLTADELRDAPPVSPRALPPTNSTPSALGGYVASPRKDQ